MNLYSRTVEWLFYYVMIPMLLPTGVVWMAYLKGEPVVILDVLTPHFLLLYSTMITVMAMKRILEGPRSRFHVVMRWLQMMGLLLLTLNMIIMALPSI